MNLFCYLILLELRIFGKIQLNYVNYNKNLDKLVDRNAQLFFTNHKLKPKKKFTF